MSNLQAYQYMIQEQWTWLLCKVSFIPANKLSLSNAFRMLSSSFATREPLLKSASIFHVWVMLYQAAVNIM